MPAGTSYSSILWGIYLLLPHNYTHLRCVRWYKRIKYNNIESKSKHNNVYTLFWLVIFVVVVPPLWIVFDVNTHIKWIWPKETFTINFQWLVLSYRIQFSISLHSALTSFASVFAFAFAFAIRILMSNNSHIYPIEFESTLQRTLKCALELYTAAAAVCTFNGMLYVHFTVCYLHTNKQF